MKSFKIQYDKSKNAANKLKHKGISLAEAELVFHDERALTLEDNDHDEQRWIPSASMPKVECLPLLTATAKPMLFESFPHVSPHPANGARIFRRLER